MFDSQYQRSELRCDSTVIHPDCSVPMDSSAVQIQKSFCYQFNLLAGRNFKNIVRLPQTSYVKLITTCVTALFAALLFWQAGALITVEEGNKNVYN